MIGNHADEADLYLLSVSTYPEERWQKKPNTTQELSGSGDEDLIQKVAVLCAPAPNVIFKNVAVTSQLIGEQIVIEPKHIVIAITWQNPSSNYSELFVYRIPENFGIGPTESSIVSPLPIIPKIQGNRISSLSNGMGGIHQDSKLNSQENYPKDGFPGALLIPSLVHQREQQSAEIDDIAQKIIVRGATTNSNADGSDPDSKNITIRVFDLFVPKKNNPPQIIESSPSQDDEMPHHHHIRPRPRFWGSVPAHRFACACALHDTGYRITLPAAEIWHKFSAADLTTTTTIPSPSPSPSSSTWQKSVFCNNSSSSPIIPNTYSLPLLIIKGEDQPRIECTEAKYDGGTVEEDDPQRRKDALGREREYVEGLIRAKKKGRQMGKSRGRGWGWGLGW